MRCSVIIVRMANAGGATAPEELLKAAAGEIERGDFARARSLCERAVAAAPEDLDALAMLGRIAMQQYRWEEAIALFDRVLRLRVDPWTLANLGNCYWKTGDLAQAEYCLRGCLQLEPALAQARVSLATVLHGLRREEEALRELDIAETSPVADYHVDSRRGCTLARLGRYDEAQAAFARAAERVGHFVYPRLVAFDRATWEAVSAGGRTLPPPRVAWTAGGDAGGGHVTLISCNPPYVRKFGLPFLRSWAERAQDDGLLHLHVYDPDATIVDEVRAAAVAAGLARLTVTTEDSPFPEERPQQRKAWYACGRLVHMEHWLAHYARPVLSLDVDFIVEDRLDAIVAAAGGADLALNPREPVDSPWLDVIANIIVAKPTPAAMAYCAAVRRYALALLEREPESWLVDQSALYCVLAMAQRFATAPAVAWLPPEIERGRLWHIGHAYDHLLQDPRYRRYAG